MIMGKDHAFYSWYGVEDDGDQSRPYLRPSGDLALGFATAFKRTTPAFRCCKNHRKQSSSLEVGSRRYLERLKDPSVTYTYTQVEAGLDALEAKIDAAGPFDVLLGFSQGTVVATLLAARRRARGLPLWRGNVLVCGIAPRDKKYPRPRRNLPSRSNPPSAVAASAK